MTDREPPAPLPSPSELISHCRRDDRTFQRVGRCALTTPYPNVGDDLDLPPPLRGVNELSLLVEGAKRIVKNRDERAATYTRAAEVAEELLAKIGEEGIAERELVTKVQQEASVVREVAVYVVDQLRSDGKARKDRELRILYRR